MRRVLSRRLVMAVVGLGSLIAVLVGSGAVTAAPPNVFTNNGCAVGNYTCLRNAGVWPGWQNWRGFYWGNYYYGSAPFYNVAYGFPRYYGYYGYANPYINPYVSYVPAGTASVSGSIVSGRTAGVNQSVSVTLGGFTPGEAVAASITAPNGQITQIGSAAAAADGTVTVTATFPSTGSWQITVKGQTSGKSVVTPYTVQ